VVLTPLRLPRLEPAQNLGTILLQALERHNLHLKKGDVLAIASKVVSICERRILSLDEVQVSRKAKRVANRWGLDERLAAIVLLEADAILGGVHGFLLTLKNGFLTANAGVDLKNSPRGTATLWPKDPDHSARLLRHSLERHFRVPIGVEVVDSRVTALRLGTVGLAIGISGFRPVKDERRKLDLYGRRVKVTRLNIADDLAASAHMLMDETTERVGAVVLRNAPVRVNGSGDSREAKLKLADCLITSSITNGRMRGLDRS
jgi:coenzyme F420-0:L-glutamate ligase